MAGRKLIFFSFLFFFVGCFGFCFEMVYGRVGIGAGFIMEKVENSTEFDGQGAIRWRQ